MTKLNKAAASVARVYLPFGGFYESILSAELDNDVTREIETINEEEGLNLTSDDFDIDYSELFEDTAEGIAEHFPYWILKNTGVDISATFVELWRPRFYNFETDRIYCDIPRDDIRKLLTWLDTEYPGYFREYVRKTLEPCSGFIPLYSNNLTDWGDFDKWDNVQLSQVLEAVSSVITGNGDSWYDTLEGDYWDQAAGNYSISDYMTRLYNPETGLPADMNVLYCLSFYLPYLVNGDTDNLTVGDMEALQKFEEEREFIDVIRKSVDNSEYRRCDISGAYGDCEPIAVKPRHDSQEVA